MKKNLPINEVEKLTDLNIPDDVRDFNGSSESVMNLFVYSKFRIDSENFKKLLSENTLRQTNNSPEDFSSYNQSSEWWKFEEEMKNPKYYTRTGNKGKWKYSLQVASAPTNNETLVYVLYFEEP